MSYTSYRGLAANAAVQGKYASRVCFNDIIHGGGKLSVNVQQGLEGIYTYRRVLMPDK